MGNPHLSSRAGRSALRQAHLGHLMRRDVGGLRLAFREVHGKPCDQEAGRGGKDSLLDKEPLGSRAGKTLRTVATAEWSWVNRGLWRTRVVGSGMETGNKLLAFEVKYMGDRGSLCPTQKGSWSSKYAERQSCKK